MWHKILLSFKLFVIQYFIQTVEADSKHQNIKMYLLALIISISSKESFVAPSTQPSPHLQKTKIKLDYLQFWPTYFKMDNFLQERSQKNQIGPNSIIQKDLKRQIIYFIFILKKPNNPGGCSFILFWIVNQHFFVDL